MDPTSLNSASFQVTTGLGTRAGRYLLDSTGRIATFYPAAPLPVNAGISVSLNQQVRDTAGNSLTSNYYLSFQTGSGPDTTRPALVGNSPLDGDMGI